MLKRGNAKTILVMVIGIVVLVGIIIAVLFLGGEKPSPISEQCAFACEGESVVGFCSVERTVTKDLRLTCETLATDSQYSKYNVQSCSAISCSTYIEEQEEESSPEGQTCAMIGGVWETPDASGNCVQDGELIKRKLIPSDNPPEAGQICCG